jgi:hypothetical protein
MVAPSPGEFSVDDTGEYTTDVHKHIALDGRAQIWHAYA